MAELYLARASGIEGFEKLVVLKRILPSFAANPQFIEMFLAEARLAAQLHHPNVVQVFDIGIADGSYFFAMEYIHGEDARAVFEAGFSGDRRLSLEHALSILIGAATGLHYAHELTDPEGRQLGIV